MSSRVGTHVSMHASTQRKQVWRAFGLWARMCACM
jgi:hypothetical protein